MSILQKLKNRGLIAAIELQFNRIVPAWFFRFSVGDVFELDTEMLCRLNESLPADELAFHHVTSANDREQLRAITWNSVPIETTENDFGFAITDVDSPQSFQGGVWGGTETFIESNLGFRMILAPDQAWIYCAYINESFRGKGAYQRLLAFAAQHLQDQGYQRLYVVIQPWNKASIHVHRKYSIRRVGRIIAIRFLRLATVFKTGPLIQDRNWTIRPESEPVHFHLP